VARQHLKHLVRPGT